jgi:hypothetical protein
VSERASIAKLSHGVSTQNAGAHVLCSRPSFFRMRTRDPPCSKETSSMATLLKWIPYPRSALRFSHRQGIGYLIRIESSSLIRNDNEDFPAGFAAAMNMNQLASLQAIAVDLKNSARKRSPTPFSLEIEL